MALLANIRHRLKSIARYNHILRVLVKYGFEDLVQHLEQTNQLTFLRKLIPKSSRKVALQYTKWEKMRFVCEELGPTFIKFGQVLSNRPDLIPIDLVLEFEKLQDNVPPMKEKIARKVISTELNGDIDKLFAWFDPIPFASASMAQVHKVTLHSGKRIALKVQRPEIKDIITEDIKIMYSLADTLQFRIPSIKSFDPVGLVKNFEDSIKKELDFINESINAQRFYNNLKLDHGDDQFAFAPKVHTSLTTTRVLALDFVSGIKIDRIEKLKEKDIDTSIIARRLSISFYKQIFEYGFFHADPHPGNLLVLPNRHICYLDFGMMGSILPRDIKIFGELFLAIKNKKVNKIILVLQELSNTTNVKDMRGFEYDINEFVEKYYVRDVHENEMSTILLEIKDIIINHGLKVPTYFYLFARSLVTIEGVLNKLDSNLDQFEMVSPYLTKSVSKNYNPIEIGKKVLNSLYELSNYMEDFPRDLKNAIHKINKGQIEVDLTHKGIDPMVHTIQRVTKQIITAFIIVAFIIGSSLFIIFEIPPLWKGFSFIGIIGYLFALLLAFGMLRDILKKDYDNW